MLCGLRLPIKPARESLLLICCGCSSASAATKPAVGSSAASWHAQQPDRLGKPFDQSHFFARVEPVEFGPHARLGDHRLGQHDVAALAFALQPRREVDGAAEITEALI